MGFIKDFSVSYVAGVAGALVVVFALDKDGSIQSEVFWLYLIILWVVVVSFQWGSKKYLQLKGTLPKE